jgi:hypothetical protein
MIAALDQRFRLPRHVELQREITRSSVARHVEDVAKPRVVIVPTSAPTRSIAIGGNRGAMEHRIYSTRLYARQPAHRCLHHGFRLIVRRARNLGDHEAAGALLAGLFEQDLGECTSDVNTDHPRPPEWATNRRASRSAALGRSREAIECATRPATEDGRTLHSERAHKTQDHALIWSPSRHSPAFFSIDTSSRQPAFGCEILVSTLINVRHDLRHLSTFVAVAEELNFHRGGTLDDGAVGRRPHRVRTGGSHLHDTQGEPNPAAICSRRPRKSSAVSTLPKIRFVCWHRAQRRSCRSATRRLPGTR